MELRRLDYLIAVLAYTGLIAGGMALARSVLRHFAGVSRRSWYALFGLLALHLFVAQALVPHAPWQPNHHGIECWADIRDGNLSSAQLTDNHGWGYFIALFGPYRYLFFEHVPVLWVASIVSTVTLLLFFLFAQALLENEVVSLGAVAIMILLPVRMRISATETMSTPLEFFLVSTLLFTRLYILHRRVAYFLVALAGLLLAMETRLEAMLFAPLITLTLFLDAPRALLETLKRPATLLPLLLFPLLPVPHLATQLAIEHGRVSQVGAMMTSAAAPFTRMNFASFFNPTYTPRIFLVPLAIGTVVLLLRARVKLLMLTLMWLPLSLAYTTYYGDVSTYVRCNANTQLALALICGVGIDDLITLARRRDRLSIAAWVTLALLPLGPLECLEFLRYRNAEQQEFALLQRATDALPADARVAMLTVTDRPPPKSALGGDSAYQRAFLRLFPPNGDRQFYSLTSLLQHPEADVSGMYYYQGTPCFRYLPCQTCPVERDAMCNEVASRYRLEPVVVETVQPVPLGGMQDPDLGEPAELGLYRLVSRSGQGGKEPLPRAEAGGDPGGVGDQVPWDHPARLSPIFYPLAFFLVPFWSFLAFLRRRARGQS